MRLQIAMLAVSLLVLAVLACGPTEDDLRELVREEIAELELPRGPEGPQGIQGPEGLVGLQGPPGEFSLDTELDTLTVKTLRVVDEQNNPVITIQEEEDQYPAIRVFGGLGQGSSLIYGLRSGKLVIKSGSTYFCVWKNQAGVCERTPEGYLDFIESDGP